MLPLAVKSSILKKGWNVLKRKSKLFIDFSFLSYDTDTTGKTRRAWNIKRFHLHDREKNLKTIVTNQTAGNNRCEITTGFLVTGVSPAPEVTLQSSTATTEVDSPTQWGKHCEISTEKSIYYFRVTFFFFLQVLWFIFKVQSMFHIFKFRHIKA